MDMNDQSSRLTPVDEPLTQQAQTQTADPPDVGSIDLLARRAEPVELAVGSSSTEELQTRCAPLLEVVVGTESDAPFHPFWSAERFRVLGLQRIAYPEQIAEQERKCHPEMSEDQIQYRADGILKWLIQWQESGCPDIRDRMVERLGQAAIDARKQRPPNWAPTLDKAMEELFRQESLEASSSKPDVCIGQDRANNGADEPHRCDCGAKDSPRADATHCWWCGKAFPN